jgi:cytidylate kinase
MNQKINIAIDGPAGAGKSTVAKTVADKLNYLYIDTGAMYRALTYFALFRKVNLQIETQIAAIMDECTIQLDGTKVVLNGVDISLEIRTSEVTNSVPTVASYKIVRDKLLKMQQHLAELGGAVMDGRDIGTHVLPNAEVKVFLTASAQERARRRHEENILKGFSSDFNQIKEEIIKRDEMDTNRKEAPLKRASDAIEVDTTSMSIEEVVDKILSLAKERV